MAISDYPRDVAEELNRAVEASTQGNEGKARVCSRRAVAFAFASFQGERRGVMSAVQILELITSSDEYSSVSRECAARLLTSVTQRGSRQLSEHPVEDAVKVIEELLGKSRKEVRP